jgi:hypothetical protein
MLPEQIQGFIACDHRFLLLLLYQNIENYRMEKIIDEKIWHARRSRQRKRIRGPADPGVCQGIE